MELTRGKRWVLLRHVTVTSSQSKGKKAEANARLVRESRLSARFWEVPADVQEDFGGEGLMEGSNLARLTGAGWDL